MIDVGFVWQRWCYLERELFPRAGWMASGDGRTGDEVNSSLENVPPTGFLHVKARPIVRLTASGAVDLDPNAFIELFEWWTTIHPGGNPQQLHGHWLAGCSYHAQAGDFSIGYEYDMVVHADMPHHFHDRYRDVRSPPRSVNPMTVDEFLNVAQQFVFGEYVAGNIG